MRTIWVTLLCVGIASSGCSQSMKPKDAVPVFPVSGTLSYLGQPMNGAIITFHAVDEQLTAQGVADDEGSYSLTTYLTNDGASDGNHHVTIYWPSAPRAEPSANDPDPPLTADRLKSQFANAKTSLLRATVETEPNVIDFELPLADRK